MAQFFGIEDIKDLTKASQTTIDWAAGSNLRIGGQAYNVTSVLTLDTATDIDTGSIASDTIYYVYTVVVAGVVSLKYSLSDSAPTGYSAYRLIGLFLTNNASEIFSTNVKSPIVKKLLSGSGTYTVPANIDYIKISAVGGGGGGAGASNNGTNNPNAGTTGSDTTFGSVFVAQGSVANGTTSSGGIGGDVVILDTDNFVVLKTVKGGSGNIAHTVINAGGVIAGGKGGDSMLGVAKPSGSSTSIDADDNSGAGGRGGGTDYVASYYASPGGGGGAGGGVIGIIPNPEASYSYTIGVGGNGGASQGGVYKSGGAGGSGVIIIEEYYKDIAV